ncbi:TDP-N-acetylfucosamine:lipid II N-acetylfucosaminyltransferase [Desulfovibrio litoralis]|uniref:4-alpha-L-fucosyltransferase glycosyl transferase group 56 n=1 Tax=Desulfovibrio litoralis DSM 11393 TaxID=1121455 RepID=A0A1M7T244_9BACT|nr:TDP-N-acetylfucosamine:lipid II N-acetylfucosaminyltransferase [Desulfovibrio litoralis]SHN64742.1 4-alpha-L-fucosyltransferase glycosyl transferase group 56 [Desulfovibrio litoralis DSM 11393]
MNVSNNLISVIIPAYNHELYIATTIKSIIAQSYKNIELLIINDGSTDRTWNVIQSFAKKCENRFVRVVFETQNNLGRYETLNKLLNLAQGKYVYLIASDNIAKPQALETLHNFLENNEGYALVAGDNEYIDGKGQTLVIGDPYNRDISTGFIYNTLGQYLPQNRPDVDFLSSDFEIFKNLLKGNSIPNGYLIRKSIFEQIVFFTKEALLKDNDLMLKISQQSKLKYLDEILFSYRIHGENISTKSVMLYPNKYCVHLMFDSKQAADIIEFINATFDSQEHVFFVLPYNDTKGITEQHSNVFFINDDLVANDPMFLGVMEKAKKIILQGMFFYEYMQFLWVNRELLPKTTWVVWGGDLAEAPVDELRINLVQNMGRIIVGSSAEKDLAKTKFNVVADKLSGGPDQQGFALELDSLFINKRKHAGHNILVGHSASKQLNHIEILCLLQKCFGNEDISIYCPLNYGDMQYAESVKLVGKNLFGEKFTSIDKKLDIQQYMTLLNDMDVAIFPQKRQQAFGTMRILLYLGTKIYCEPLAGSSEIIQDAGGIIYDINTIKDISFSEFIINPTIEKNRQAIKPYLDNTIARKNYSDICY